MSTTKKNYLYRMTSVILEQGTLLVSSFVGARLLNIQEYAQYSYLLTIISITIMLADFGLSTAVTKHIAYDPNEKSSKEILSNSYFILLCTTLLISMSLLCLKIVGILPIEWTSLILMTIIIILSTASTLQEGILRGNNRFLENLIAAGASALITLPLQYYLIKTEGVVGGLTSQLIYALVSFITVFTLSKMTFTFSINKQALIKLIKYSIQFGIASLSYFLFSKYVIIILGNGGEWNSLASYDILSKVMLIFTFPFSIYGQVIAPKFAHKLYVNDVERTLKETLRYTKAMTLISIVASLLFYFSGLFIQYLLPQYATIPEFTFILNITTLLLFVYTWTNIVDTGIIVPTGYAYIMTFIYPLIASLSLFILPLSLKAGGYKSVFISLIILQLIMAVFTRLVYVFLLKRKLVAQNLK